MCQRSTDRLIPFCLHALLKLLYFPCTFLSSCVCSLSPCAEEKKKRGGGFLWWVRRCILAEVPGSIAQGRPADNYKPFSKHSLAAHGDILMVSQKTNRSLTRQRQRNTAYVSHATASTRLETRIESCRDNRGSLDSLKRMAIERGKAPAGLIVIPVTYMASFLVVWRQN